MHTQQAVLERLRRAEQIISIFERMIEDLTPQHYLDNLRRVHRYLTELHMAMPGALVVFGADGVIQEVNSGALALLGHDGLVGQPVEVLGEDLQRVATSGDESPLTRRKEMLLRSAAGSPIPVLVSWGRMESAEGTTFVCVGLDLREQKRLELELHHAHKLEAVGQLAAGIAHEINTPLQYVGDNLQFINDSFSDLMQLVSIYERVCSELERGAIVPTLIDELREAVSRADLEFIREQLPSAFQHANDGITRVTKIVRAMKEFAHPKGNKVAYDVNNALKTTTIIAKNEYKYVADLELDLGELPAVKCHGDEMNQVFLNLIVNASHAIASVVGSSGARGVLRLTTRRDNNMATVAISDTGCGIPEPIRHRVFDPFFTTKEVGKGTGQGLAIARAIVDKHGGTLTFESEVGRGTTFIITIPIDGTATPSEVV